MDEHVASLVGQKKSKDRFRLGKFAAQALKYGIMVIAATSVSAQVGEDFLSRTGPIPPYHSPQPQRYNLKWGNLTGRLTGSVVTEFNDNINLSENNPVADISFGPELGIGFLYPISDKNVLQVDFGLGYRWYLNSPDVSTFTLSPRTSSRIDYYIYHDEGRVNFHDTFSLQIDPVDFGALTASGGVNLANYRRFVNTAGVMADWRPARKWNFYVGYDYTIDRTLTSQFGNLDRDDHTFSSGVNYVATPRLTLGAFNSLSYSIYRQNVQNNGWNMTIGPRMSYKMTRFVDLEASMGYTTSSFGNNGSVTDQSNFSSYTFQVGIRHTINKRTSHAVRAGRNMGLGYGSNFTDTYNVQYSINWRATEGISLYGTAAYENFTVSNAGETADRLLFNLGTAYRLSRNWNLGVSYTFSTKQSNLFGNNYTQNRITLDLTRSF